MVRTASSRYQARNSSSRNSSGSSRFSPSMTRCSSSPDSLSRFATRSDSRRIRAETIQCDSSTGEEMCRFFSSIRRRTALVSRNVT